MLDVGLYGTKFVTHGVSRCRPIKIRVVLRRAEVKVNIRPTYLEETLSARPTCLT